MWSVTCLLYVSGVQRVSAGPWVRSIDVLEQVSFIKCGYRDKAILNSLFENKNNNNKNQHQREKVKVPAHGQVDGSELGKS